MGVKSTIDLTRDEAESRLVDLFLDIQMEKVRFILRGHVAQMDNTDLEDQLEDLNDERAGGEGFENYRIV
jgi:hypothetical protein